MFLARSILAILAGLTLGARAGELSSADAQAARKIYEVKCAKCHKFYEPLSYSKAEWNHWLGKMARKSRLKPDQERILAGFLDAYRERGKVERP